jgi:hypothetical protein
MGSLTPSFVLRPSLPRSHERQRAPLDSIRPIAQLQEDQAVHAHCRPGASFRDCRLRDRLRSKAGGQPSTTRLSPRLSSAIGLGDPDERREVHVLMGELDELDAPFLPLESVSENV